MSNTVARRNLIQWILYLNAFTGREGLLKFDGFATELQSEIHCWNLLDTALPGAVLITSLFKVLVLLSVLLLRKASWTFFSVSSGAAMSTRILVQTFHFNCTIRASASTHRVICNSISARCFFIVQGKVIINLAFVLEVFILNNSTSFRNDLQPTAACYSHCIFRGCRRWIYIEHG